ncbi:hypothetical protein [[Clostridium] hylemonae]|uniref:Uncharacterized protein n=1 Tax=[Clostridium] hylemonae DSM 15053 TaxID=553973 RepID=C0C514_9FIRM|nr:hypothetical protein [[Clostridium] hylemonae]EEG72782.1 hypothetical protein CLOHYLEM_07182 [[Clostridium] hylemonae DSM 15053]QEK16109.1 hypothetical protein LAJLEIBI_00087 [[Clostridium] hylemonae DSM 15053]
MRTKRLSPLGFLMECLNIQTVSLSRELHVDASLVSKWKSGDRSLNSNSMYFEDIIRFIMKVSEKSDHQLLSKALSEIYPLEGLEGSSSPEPFVRKLLFSEKLTLPNLKEFTAPGIQPKIQIGSCEQNSGRRHAVLKLLDYAETLPVPGRIIFIDSEEYGWLLEDEAFVRHFAEKMNVLLGRGFSARFVIHFSSYRQRFVRFFEMCNLLLFHRNVEWFYYEYYDENVFQFSQFILDKAISLLGISAGQDNSTTMVFTDTPSIIRHWTMAESVISRCEKLFVNFPVEKCADVVEYIRVIRKRGTLYAYLPAPAFVSAQSELLSEILTGNHIDPATTDQCLIVNQRMRDIVHTQFRGLEDAPERIVQILQLEEMERRAFRTPFISCSLTLLGGRQVNVTKPQYARCLRSLADALDKHENLEIVFLSEGDNAPLPAIPEMNCWCKQNTWMVQMDQKGFRLSDEASIVNAASVTFERCIRRIPPKRKEKSSVTAYLLQLADTLERSGV